MSLTFHGLPPMWVIYVFCAVVIGLEPSAALLVLMATLENSTHSKALANTAKHVAFPHCGELNLYGMVDAQIAVIEGELLAGTC